MILQDMRRHDEALASFDAALALQPINADALNNRGSVLHALGRADEALASYDRALALQSNDAQVLYNRAMRSGNWNVSTRRSRATTGACPAA